MLEYGNGFVYVNNQGYMLEISSIKKELPILIGISTSKEDYKAGNRLNEEDLIKLGTVIKIMNSAQTNGIASLITKIDISNENNYTLFLETERKTAYLGDCSNLETRMLFLVGILEKEKENPGEIFINMNLNTDDAYFRLNKKQIALTLGIVCLILTMFVVIQIRTTNNANKVVSQTFTSNDLRNQVLKWKERYDTTYAELQSSEKKLEDVRQQASENTDGSDEKEAKLKKNNILIGLTDVTGEGVIVTLKDNNTVTADSNILDPSMVIVHMPDILGVINELKNAGAEAKSINDQRVVSTTSLTCEGNIININGEKISSPFVIKAIGSSIYMNSALTRAGGTIEYLNRYIQASVKTSNNITIGKYTGVLNPKYIKYTE